MTLHLAARHASWVGLAAVAPATWWWVGLLVGDSGTDAIIRPVDISNGTAAAIGATSTAIVLASLVVVLRGRSLHLVPGAPVMALATCAPQQGMSVSRIALRRPESTAPTSVAPSCSMPVRPSCLAYSPWRSSRRCAIRVRASEPSQVDGGRPPSPAM